MNNTVPKHIQRLREREILLERRAGFHMERIKDTAEYVKTDGVRLIGGDFAESIEDQSPFVARLINAAVGNKPPKSTQPKRRGLLSSLFGRMRVGDSRGSSSFSAVGNAVMPFIYSLGELKLLSYSLKGAGKIMRYSFRNLFGRKGRRRKRK